MKNLILIFALFTATLAATAQDCTPPNYSNYFQNGNLLERTRYDFELKLIETTNELCFYWVREYNVLNGTDTILIKSEGREKCLPLNQYCPQFNLFATPQIRIPTANFVTVLDSTYYPAPQP